MPYKPKIYQIYYDEISKSKLDKGFTPYNNSENLKDIFENQVIIDVFKNRKIEWEKSSHVGILSWRLYEKTGITSEHVLKSVGKKPVYMLTPPSCFKRKSPVSSSGFKTSIALAKLFDKHKVFPFKVYNYNNGKCVNCCNYWMASPEVFSDYVENFLIKAVEFCRTNREAVEISSTMIRYRGQLYPSIVFFLEALFQIYVHHKKIDYEYISSLHEEEELDNTNLEHRTQPVKQTGTKVIIKKKPEELKVPHIASRYSEIKSKHEQRLSRLKSYTPQDHKLISENYCAEDIKVSVIVTLYNYEKCIEKCLLSAINQRVDFGYEIIVVNDNSTDNSLKVAKAVLSWHDIPYKIIDKSKNTGLAHSRNQGIEYASGKYYFVLDADNYIHEHCLATHYNELEKTGNIACYAKIKCFEDGTGREYFLSSYPFSPETLFTKGNYIDAMAMFHREKVRIIGGYDQNMPYMGWEDFDLWLNIAHNKNQVDFIDKELSYYWSKPDSMINDTNLFKRQLVSYLNRKYNISLQ